jgi:hypothetical protein
LWGCTDEWAGSPTAASLGLTIEIAREAWIDSRTFLELEAMLSREGRPEQLRELMTALARRVDRAIETKASYIIELLGERQTGAILGPLWDQRARAIETTRLRNGIGTDNKPLTNTVESIVGPKRGDAEWKQASEIINDAIEPPAEKQTRSRSLRR